MAERPYVSFAEVKQKVSLLEVLQVLDLGDRFTQVGKTWTGVCPLPSHRHGPQPNSEQFKINCKDGIWLWHCFGDCQQGGDVIEFVKAMTGFDNQHVRFWFAEKFRDRLASKRPPKKKETAQVSDSSVAEGDPNEKARATPGKENSQRADSKTSVSIVSSESAPLKPLRFKLNLDPDVPYLKQRGLTTETIRRFGIGLCRKGTLEGYVAIPVFGYPRGAEENPVGYLGRWPGEDFTVGDADNTTLRYKFPVDFPRNRVVYGLSEAFDGTDGKPLIVVEGAFKVYHLAQNGFPNAVAIFGSSLSDEQAAILAATGKQLVLMFDGDEAGQCGMRRAAGKLIVQSYVRVVKLPVDKEPDHLSAVELQEFLS